MRRSAAPHSRTAFTFVLVTLLLVAGQNALTQVSIGGIDWKGARQPQLVADSQGTLYVALGRTNSVYVARSDDHGASFSAPQLVDTVPKLGLGMRRGPRIATGEGGQVLVSAISHADGTLYAWRSTDGGKTWSARMPVNSAAASAREGLHAMVAGPKGQVFMTWLDLRNGSMELWGARSANFGKTWEKDQSVYRSPNKTICECCHPSALFKPDGDLVVMWRNVLEGNRDMYYLTSHDEPGESGVQVKVVRE